MDCGNIFYWGDITHQGVCQRWKADVAFAFLSAIFWLGSALLVIQLEFCLETNFSQANALNRAFGFYVGVVVALLDQLRVKVFMDAVDGIDLTESKHIFSFWRCSSFSICWHPMTT